MSDPYSHEFKTGDRVAQSARFLRSLGTLTFASGNSGPSTNDLGKGTVISTVGDLIDVWFDCKQLRRFNRHNLIHERDIYLESMRAEHDGRYNPR